MGLTPPQNDPQITLRTRILWTCVAYYAHASMALIFGSMGPTFLDIIHLIDATVETGSFIFTSQAIGGIFGGLVSAWTYTKFPKENVITLTLLSCACFTILLPFCPMMELMCVVAGLRGVSMFLTFTGCALICIENWRQNDGSPLLQALHCAFSAGGVVAPFIVSPFLGEDRHLNQTSLQQEVSIATNQTNTTAFGNLTSPENKVHIGYLIIGALILVNFLCSLFMVCSPKVRKHHGAKNAKKEMVSFVDKIAAGSRGESSLEEKESLALNVKILFIALIALYFMLIVAFESLMQNYLSTFVTRYLSWTKVEGAQISSAFWASFATGRFLGIFAAKLLSPWKIIAIDLFLLTITATTINLTINNHEIILWICVSGSGIFISGLYAAGSSLVDEDMISITGKTYAVFLVSGTTGTVIYPIILGYLIDNFSSIWFLYLAEIMCIICVVDFVFITLMIRRWGKSKRKPATI